MIYDIISQRLFKMAFNQSQSMIHLSYRIPKKSNQISTSLTYQHTPPLPFQPPNAPLHISITSPINLPILSTVGPIFSNIFSCYWSCCCFEARRCYRDRYRMNRRWKLQRDSRWRLRQLRRETWVPMPPLLLDDERARASDDEDDWPCSHFHCLSMLHHFYCHYCCWC